MSNPIRSLTPIELRQLSGRLSKLESSQKAKILKALTPRLTKYIPHRPTPKQTAFLLLDCFEALYGGSGGGGKLLALDTPIPTVGGWTTMCDVRAGDLVFTELGQPCRVIAAHEAEIPVRAYRLTFDDGSQIDAGGEHKWLTFDTKELLALTHRSSEWRAARRKKRPSRASGLRTAKFTQSISARNSANPPQSLPLPTGTIRTTDEIANTLRPRRGVANHAIAVAEPLVLPGVQLPLDPYLLGVWLGDGTSASGSITSADPEIIDAFSRGGFTVNKQSGLYAYGIHGLSPKLRQLGLLKNKHIPPVYLRASREQRLALVQGLMDTDGSANESGQAEFTNTNPRLMAGILELLISLGQKARITTGRAMLRGRDCGPKYRIKWTASEIVFRLKRKRDRQKLSTRRTKRFRYVTDCQPITPIPMRCITVDNPTGLYLAGRAMIPTHNSDALLMAALQYFDQPDYHALLLRKTITDLSLPGALIPRSHEWLANTDAKWNGMTKTWTSPVGATLTFGYMEHVNDKYRYSSAEFQYIGIDETTQFLEDDVKFLFSRLRRREGSRIPLRLRGATNPIGIGRMWVKQRYVDNSSVQDRIFIPAKLADNPNIDREQYVKSLMHLDPITRSQILDGDWEAQAAGKFRRHWFNKFVDAIPMDARFVRYWDLAATEAAPGKDPSWTVGALMAEHGGRYFICDVRRDRLTPHGVEDLIKQTAEIDGVSVDIWMEQEPGSAGVGVISHYTELLNRYGFHGDKVTGPKEIRANAFASQAEAGNVYLLRAPWIQTTFPEAPSVGLLEIMLSELTLFPGGGHDDIVVALVGAYNALVGGPSADLSQLMALGERVEPDW